MSLVAGQKDFVEGEPGHALAQLVELRQCFGDLRLFPFGLGDEPGDRPAVAGDDDGFAALDVIEEPGADEFLASETWISRMENFNQLISTRRSCRMNPRPASVAAKC